VKTKKARGAAITAQMARMHRGLRL
jgi:hypothetical protein